MEIRLRVLYVVYSQIEQIRQSPNPTSDAALLLVGSLQNVHTDKYLLYQSINGLGEYSLYFSGGITM